MSETNARVVGPFTEDDERRGEAIVQALHGIRGYDAWTIYIAQQLAAERRAALSAPVPSEEEVARATEFADQLDSTDVEAWAWLLGLEFTHDSEAEDAKALVVKALRALSLYSRSVPEGWKLVPEEPTDEQALQGLRALVEMIEKMCGPLPPLPPPDENGTVHIPDDVAAQRFMTMGAVMRTSKEIIACYRAMLAAAPHPKREA